MHNPFRVLFVKSDGGVGPGGSAPVGLWEVGAHLTVWRQFSLN